MSPIIIVLLFLAVAAAAVSDLRTGLISNWISYPCAGAALILHSAAGPIPGLVSLLVMIAVLAACLPIFAFGLLRGGDIKLIVACCGLLSYQYSFPFLLYTMLAGGVLALVVAWRAGSLKQSLQAVGAIAHPLLHGVLPRSLPFTTKKIPYGVAIFGGACLTILAITVAPALKLVSW